MNLWVGLVSLFPEMIGAMASVGILGRAIRRGEMGLEVFNPRDHASDRRRTVDDRPYGGGPGMVMMAEPLLGAIGEARERAPSPPRVVYLSPQGARLDQSGVERLSRLPSLVLIAGRYEGIDERVIEMAVDEELSIGDYILSGGELPAMVLVDALCRLLPGALNNEESIQTESLLDGLLEYPQYTRPEQVGPLAVPAVLLGGDHGAVGRWRRTEALLRTWRRRPDLLTSRALSDADSDLLKAGMLEAGLQQKAHAGAQAPNSGGIEGE